MIVIGLTGYKGTGKSTVADFLVQDYGFTAVAFADPLKRMLRRLDPIIGHDLYAGCCNECSDIPEVTEVRMSDALKFGFDDNSLKHSPWADEVRDLWERFGTEVMREEYEDYWIDKAFAGLPPEADRVVFTDVRFENEAKAITDLDRSNEIQASLWRIARPGYEAGDHAAEQMAGLLGERLTLINDGTVDELGMIVDAAMDTISLADQIPGQLAFDFEGLQ